MLNLRSNNRWCALLAVLLTVAACSTAQHAAPPTPARQSASSSVAAPTSSTAEAQPQDLAAAIAAAQEKNDRHTSGDFEGEWLLFTKDLRDHLSQQAFTEYSQACARTGLKIKVTGGRLDGPDRAVVRFELLGVTKGATMAYEDGGWYKVPDDFLTANYGKTAAELIAADKADGNCSG